MGRPIRAEGILAEDQEAARRLSVWVALPQRDAASTLGCVPHVHV
ncbi:MAG: hypothetical protein R6W93_06915 [Candidatus Limnocylindrales bacterium]